MDLGEGPHVVVGPGAVGRARRRPEVLAGLRALAFGLVEEAQVEVGVELLGGAAAPVVADARETGLETGRFSAIVDKGTLDAICSGEGYDYEAGRLAAECKRLLAPGGVWVCVSLLPPAVLLPLLERQEWASLDAEPLEHVHCYTATAGEPAPCPHSVHETSSDRSIAQQEVS